MCICTHSALIKLEKNCYSKNLLLLHLQVVIIYSFNSFSKSIKVDDLIVNKKKVKKKQNKKINILSHIKFQNTHCFFKHKI